MKNLAAQKEKSKGHGYLYGALAFIIRMCRSLTHHRVEVTGTGVQRSTNFNIFFQFSYQVARKYNLKTLEVEAANRYNLSRCTILNLSEAKEVSFIFSPVTGKSKKMDRIQYLELT